MKYYKILVNNGCYPLIYKCGAIANAYGCIKALGDGLLGDIEIDLDSIMELLVSMKQGKTLSHQDHGWSICVCEEGKV